MSFRPLYEIYRKHQRPSEVIKLYKGPESSWRQTNMRRGKYTFPLIFMGGVLDWIKAL